MRHDTGMMVRAWRTAAAWHLAASLIPGAMLAQQGGGCRPELVRAGFGRQVELATGEVRSYLSGGVLIRCTGQGTTLQSDSLAWYGDLGRLDFLRQVQFEDDTVTLTADRARYFPRDERLEAFGEVRLHNRHTGSVLTGPRLVYWRVAPNVRDTVELYAPDRPTLAYRPRSDTAASPYLIVGEWMRLRGGAAWAAGNVTVVREDFEARSDSAEIDLDAGAGVLVGGAEVRGTDTTGYTLAGRRIAYRLADDRLTWVQAQGSGQATSAEWRIVGDTIELHVADDLIQGGSAWGATRPQALSAAYTVAADSLALDAPDQVLTQLRGFGAAHATARSDSTRDVADWMAGDTVIARFDTGADARRVLTLLDAAGNARAYYHIFDDTRPDDPPAISYSRGGRVTARFGDDGLERVEVVGAADGLYLEPVGRRPR